VRRALLLGSVLLASVQGARAQSVLERSPNLQGDWMLPGGSAVFVVSHRFEFLSGGDELFSVPTLTLAGGLPFGLAAGLDFTSFSEVVADELAGNETQLWLKRRVAEWGDGGVAGLIAYNTVATSVDGALSGRHGVGPLSLFGELRAFSSMFGTDDGGLAGALGAAVRLTPYLALTGDVGRVLSADTFDVAWSAAVAMGLPGTPHTLSFQATNGGATTLQGASRPKVAGPESMRFGFAFTAPLSPARLVQIFRPAPDVAPPGAEIATRVEMRQIAFVPGEVRIRVGETVEWLNMDPVAHTVTAADGSWGSELFGLGEAYRRTFTEPGRYPYFCLPHPQMRGVVVVE